MMEGVQQPKWADGQMNEPADDEGPEGKSTADQDCRFLILIGKMIYAKIKYRFLTNWNATCFPRSKNHDIHTWSFGRRKT